MGDRPQGLPKSRRAPVSRPVQDVKVFGIQDRRSQATAQRPWLVRWAVNGRQKSKSFRTKAEADRCRSHLVLAVTRGEPFDPGTAEPVSWAPPAQGPSTFDDQPPSTNDDQRLATSD